MFYHSSKLSFTNIWRDIDLWIFMLKQVLRIFFICKYRSFESAVHCCKDGTYNIYKMNYKTFFIGVGRLFLKSRLFCCVHYILNWKWQISRLWCRLGRALLELTFTIKQPTNKLKIRILSETSFKCNTASRTSYKNQVLTRILKSKNYLWQFFSKLLKTRHFLIKKDKTALLRCWKKSNIRQFGTINLYPLTNMSFYN